LRNFLLSQGREAPFIPGGDWTKRELRTRSAFGRRVLTVQ